jgi:hypothetical protein
MAKPLKQKQMNDRDKTICTSRKKELSRFTVQLPHRLRKEWVSIAALLFPLKQFASFSWARLQEILCSRLAFGHDEHPPNVGYRTSALIRQCPDVLLTETVSVSTPVWWSVQNTAQLTLIAQYPESDVRHLTFLPNPKTKGLSKKQKKIYTLIEKWSMNGLLDSAECQYRILRLLQSGQNVFCELPDLGRRSWSWRRSCCPAPKRA